MGSLCPTARMRLRGTEMGGGVFCPEELRPEGGSRPLANGSYVWCPGHQAQGKQFRRRQVSREHCREGQRPARRRQAQDTGMEQFLTLEEQSVHPTLHRPDSQRYLVTILKAKASQRPRL